MRSEPWEFVPCDHSYLNFKGGKFSKSRGAAVEVPYFLTKYDPDALRFYLTATLPETRDTEGRFAMGTNRRVDNFSGSVYNRAWRYLCRS